MEVGGFIENEGRLHYVKADQVYTGAKELDLSNKLAGSLANNGKILALICLKLGAWSFA